MSTDFLKMADLIQESNVSSNLNSGLNTAKRQFNRAIKRPFSFSTYLLGTGKKSIFLDNGLT
jgi:hypothetical protein